MSEAITMRPVTEVIQAGKGAQATAVSVHDGMVIIHFQHSCEWASFDPESARRFAEQVARFAYQAHWGRPPSDAESATFMAQGMRRKITKILQQKMINRTVMLLRNFQDQRQPLPYQAEQIVGHILREVL